MDVKAGGDLRFATETDTAFWTAAIEKGLGPGGRFHAWLAYLDNEPLAFRVALDAGDTSYMIANQYDERFSEYRLGWILALEHIRYACEHGTRRIDSAPGDLHYKGRLGGTEASMRMDVLAFRNSARGRMLAGTVRAVRAAGDWLGRRPWGRHLAAKLPKL